VYVVVPQVDMPVMVPLSMVMRHVMDHHVVPMVMLPMVMLQEDMPTMLMLLMTTILPSPNYLGPTVVKMDT